MMPPTPSNAERDREEAEFLLGNALLQRIILDMQTDAIETAMNAYAAGRKDAAEVAMVQAQCVREIARKLQELLRVKAGRKPVT